MLEYITIALLSCVALFALYRALEALSIWLGEAERDKSDAQRYKEWIDRQ